MRPRLVEFEGDEREAIALPIEKVRALIDQAMSTMATTPFGRSPRYRRFYSDAIDILFCVSIVVLKRKNLPSAAGFELTPFLAPQSAHQAAS